MVSNNGNKTGGGSEMRPYEKLRNIPLSVSWLLVWVWNCSRSYRNVWHPQSASSARTPTRIRSTLTYTIPTMNVHVGCRNVRGRKVSATSDGREKEISFQKEEKGKSSHMSLRTLNVLLLDEWIHCFSFKRHLNELTVIQMNGNRPSNMILISPLARLLINCLKMQRSLSLHFLRKSLTWLQSTYWSSGNKVTYLLSLTFSCTK